MTPLPNNLQGQLRLSSLIIFLNISQNHPLHRSSSGPFLFLLGSLPGLPAGRPGSAGVPLPIAGCSPLNGVGGQWPPLHGPVDPWVPPSLCAGLVHECKGHVGTPGAGLSLPSLACSSQVSTETIHKSPIIEMGTSFTHRG